MTELIFIAMIYESIIVIISSILLILIFIKYKKKKHELTLYLFVIFFFFTLAIFFSWFSKVLVIYSNYEYIKDIYNTSDPGTIESWFILRIVDFRFSLIFTTIAIFFSYIFKVKIFHEANYNPKYKIIVVLLGIFIVFYNLFIYIAGSVILMIFAFFFTFIYMLAIYFPFMKCSMQFCIEAEDILYKRAFMSLTLMCIGFLLIFFLFTIDRILIFYGSSRFTIFYFLAWASAIIGMIGAYLGYIRPKSKES